MRLRAAGLLRLAVGGATLLAALTMVSALPAQADDVALADDLYLITMAGPGTAGYTGSFSDSDYRTGLLQRQDATLSALGESEPVQRWTTALSGMSVRLDAAQAARARTLTGVRLVEPDRLRRLAGVSPATRAAGHRQGGRGGASTVIGFVDSGLDTTGAVFADSAQLGKMPARFSGDCPEDAWGDSTCNRKVVGARYFIDAFGADRLRSGASVSAQDDQGHGTMVAALAAGNAATPSGTARRVADRFRGIAPDARVAVYKACWEAPDPTDDGCATADVVSAIDAAVADGVDVLNVSVSGTPGLDTVDLALLGAAERDIVVVAAAGNDGGDTGHDVPWVTTVGASVGGGQQGALVLDDGTRLRGTLSAGRTREPLEVVEARSIPAPGSTPAQAALCGAGSLDSARADDRIVVCDRGDVARLEKSRTVRMAGGTAMVLVNEADQEMTADLHSVPTVNLSAGEGRQLRHRLAAGRVTARLTPAQATSGSRLLDWSATGSNRATQVKPDLLAPGLGLLTATTPRAGHGRWDLLSGSSASAALTSGVAARLRSQRPGWSAARVRSALSTSARPLSGQVLSTGAGALDAAAASRTVLVQDVARSAWREFLDGDRTTLNLPSALVSGDRTTEVRRRVTNAGARAGYWSVSVSGFRRHQVKVAPEGLRLKPGERHSVRITITPTGDLSRGPRQLDDGYVIWRNDAGDRVRMPLVIR